MAPPSSNGGPALAAPGLGVHNPAMSDPCGLESLKFRLDAALEESLALPRVWLSPGLGPELNPGRPFRRCFEALVGVYLDYCDSEREAWLGAEPAALIRLGAGALLPLAQAVLAVDSAFPRDEGLEETLSLEEACLSIWALLEGSLREALALDPSLGAARSQLTAAARALEYMVGGLADAGSPQAGGP